MAAQCADALWQDDPAGAVAIRALASSFSAMLGVETDSIMAAVETAREVALAELSLAPLGRPAAGRAQTLAATRMHTQAHQVLRAGLAAMAGALATATPSQMMAMAFDTLHNGLSLRRAAAFVRNRRAGKYQARLGLGDGVAARLAQMVFDDAYRPDVFHAALGSDRVIFIDNPQEPRFAARLPAWWHASLAGARSFVILPVCCNGQPAGFIYGDWDQGYPPFHLTQVEFALMNELRAVAASSLEARQKLETSGR